MLHGHGDDAYNYATNIQANFSSNVFDTGFTDDIKNHLITQIQKVTQYPEPTAHHLQKEIAQYHDISENCILVTNGSTEAFYLIAQLFKNKSATVIIPSFAEYEDACVSANIQLSFLNWEHINNNTEFKTDVVFLGNPNNPTGSIFPKNIVKQLLSKNTNTVFVIDEAYSDFVTEKISMENDIKHFPNLIIVKSLTKRFEIPGLRIGYIIANYNYTKYILKSRIPWTINSLAIEAAIYIVRHKLREPFHIQPLLSLTQLLANELSNIAGIEVYVTNTNFFLCKTLKSNAPALKQFLIDHYGILIRDASNYRGLSPQFFRIATQTPEKNNLLVQAIMHWATIN